MDAPVSFRQREDIACRHHQTCTFNLFFQSSTTKYLNVNNVIDYTLANCISSPLLLTVKQDSVVGAFGYVLLVHLYSSTILKIQSSGKNTDLVLLLDTQYHQCIHLETKVTERIHLLLPRHQIPATATYI